MWSKLRDTVMGIAEQAGIEVPGLDTAGGVVTDLTASAGEAATTVASEIGAPDLAGQVSDVLGVAAPTELAAGATDAVASPRASLAGAVEGTPTTADGLLNRLTGGQPR
jgi:hypothetical protein